MTSQCDICGDFVASEAVPAWFPIQQSRLAERDMQEHLLTHSFVEMLRHELRQDLDSVPEEQRASIVRDIYRGLLGTTEAGQFALDDADSQGVYSIDEALGGLGAYRLWHSANGCGDPGCAQH